MVIDGSRQSPAPRRRKSPSLAGRLPNLIARVPLRSLLTAAVCGALAVTSSLVSSSLFAPTPAAALAPASAATPSSLPSSSASSGSRFVTVTCADVGALHLILTPAATPAPATALPSGVSLRTAYQATDSRTAALVTGGQRGEVSCGQVLVSGVQFSALSSGPAPAGVVAADRFDGFIAVSLVISTQQHPLTPLAVPDAGSPFPFAAQLQAYLATRSGHVSVSVFDATSGATYSFNPGTRYVTASIVKVAILGTVLRQAQDAHRALTSAEGSLATSMIEQSDNNAATALWNDAGQGPGVGSFMSKVPMPSTTPGSNGYWGLTATNAPDQVRLVRTVAYPNEVLSNASRGYEESLMRAVTPSQKWGVSGGVPASATVALKNGWLPRSDGWEINSIGHISSATRNYVIAVLTSGDPSMSYGITTVQNVSSMAWQHLERGSPIGSLDAVATGPDRVAASGWAIDPDTKAAIIVQMYIDRRANALAWANRPRPDVGAAYPAYGPNHGYTMTMSTTPGPHTVCLFAINTGPGASKLLGCRAVTVPSPNDPIGSLDAVSAGTGRVTARGWAIDPNSRAAIIVQMYIDRRANALAWANRPRPDVGAAYPAYGPNHGYTMTMSTTPGPHTVCLFAINTGPGASKLLGCRAVAVP
jgi:beta-lactamase class A